MRAAAATIFVFLLVTVGFIILNLQPATISIFGLVQMTQPLGVVVSIAFLGGALIAYLLIEDAGIIRSWRERNRRKVSFPEVEDEATPEGENNQAKVNVDKGPSKTVT